MRRIVREAALDDGAEGSRWLEIQVDPTSYAPFVGGITPALEIVLDEARSVSASAGAAQVGVVVAASRMRHPLEASTLARLAARHAGSGPGAVVGFGLSNDERRGVTEEFAARLRHRAAGRADARAARRASCWGRRRWPRRSTRSGRSGWGTGCARWRTRGCSSGSCARGWRWRCARCRTCRWGSTTWREDVPLRTLVDAGARVALGADDPLIFGSRLADQYATARVDHGFRDAELAALARGVAGGQPGAVGRAGGGGARHRRLAGRTDAERPAGGSRRPGRGRGACRRADALLSDGDLSGRYWDARPQASDCHSCHPWRAPRPTARSQCDAPVKVARVGRRASNRRARGRSRGRRGRAAPVPAEPLRWLEADGAATRPPARRAIHSAALGALSRLRRAVGCGDGHGQSAGWGTGFALRCCFDEPAVPAARRRGRASRLAPSASGSA